MKKIKCLMAFLICLPVVLGKMLSADPSFTKKDFIHPPIHFWPRPLYFWNNTTVTAEGLTRQMQAFRDECGYGGFGVIPFGKNFRPEYLSEEYLQLYGTMLQKAKELGMTICLYDEFGFPSGSVGAFREGDDTPRFQRKYPQWTIQRLDKTEKEITGPLAYEIRIPDGILMGVVAMGVEDLKRIDLSGNVQEGILKWQVPAGNWKILIFICVLDGYPVADYLDPEANEKFTSMVHDAYYARFKEYFGSVISGTFFDEPSMFHAKFRMWTPRFNQKFTRKFGFSPVLLYPALWYDIGPETAAARNTLFGFRAELFALGFTKVVNDWSLAHGITATGHTAPEEAIVPANASGDLMKSFRYLEIPGIDKIGGQRYAERFYKLISSSAYNWDRKLVMSETYGAMPDYDKPGDLTWNEIWSIAMDQYTKGINMLIPHAVWYDNTKVTYKPELSSRNPLYADRLKEYTTFLSRLNVILQTGGRHVADIAVLYPIHSLLSEHYFYTQKGPANVDGRVDPANRFYQEAIAKIDYVDIANWLTNSAGKDFTFLHPEVLDEKCIVSNRALRLQNQTNPETYKVLILPSCEMISLSNMCKIRDFYQSGGSLIFTTRLPRKSVEMGKDQELATLVRSIFPVQGENAEQIRINGKGGKACFLPFPDGQKLAEALQKVASGFDVEYPSHPDLQYIHKVIDRRNVYYFANLGGRDIQTSVALRGQFGLEAWDPHTGEFQKMNTVSLKRKTAGSYSTSVPLNLKPYRSVFLVEESQK